jgi:hypothetical protein
MRHHDATTAGDVSSSDSTFDLFSSLTVCGAPAVIAGDVRVYLAGYIFCIINCHICQDIFGRVDIMYYRLPYVSRGVLALKTLVLYIYRPSGTMQYNQQPTIIPNQFFLYGIRLGSDHRSLPLPSSAPTPGRSISTPPRAAPLVRRPILLIQPSLRRVKPSTD